MREIIFVRGRDPKIQMDIGIGKEIRTWLNVQKPEHSSYCIMGVDIENGFIIDVQGDIVLEDNELKEHYKVKFRNVTGNITILSQLTKEELYDRIRNYYNIVLDNCLGKKNEEQQIFLYGEVNRTIENQSGKIVLSLGENYVDDSEEYIRNLPENLPSNMKIIEIVNQILSGKGKGSLEYGHHAMDRFSVEMYQYASALKKSLNKQ